MLCHVRHMFLYSMYFRALWWMVLIKPQKGETHCVSCQSWLPFYPHDSGPTLEAMQKHTRNKSESVPVLFVLLFYSGAAKYNLGHKQTHMWTESSDWSCFVMVIEIFSPQLSQHGLSGSAEKGTAFLCKQEKNGCLPFGFPLFCFAVSGREQRRAFEDLLLKF